MLLIIKTKIERPNYFVKYLAYIVALFFICLIAFISLNYYQKEKYHFEGYKLANNSDIKYTNINTVL